MGIDEVGIDKVGIDEVGRYQKVLWCRSCLVWLVFERFIPTCACSALGKLCCDLFYTYLVSFTLICCILSECMLVQNNFFVKLNYVERRLSRLCGGHGELPCEVLLRNLMELCELRQSRSG